LDAGFDRVRESAHRASCSQHSAIASIIRRGHRVAHLQGECAHFRRSLPQVFGVVDAVVGEAALVSFAAPVPDLN
jgi:hypothetical protein